jgi:hypothetical protein
LPFFDKGLNAAAGSGDAGPPFGWPRVPATTESLTTSKFILVLILLLVLQVQNEMSDGSVL